VRPDSWNTAPQDPTGTTTYLVPGMTRRQSADAVTMALLSVPGIRHISVDLNSTQVRVHSTHPVEETTIVAVIAEAGYAVAGVHRANS
jgi:copper chaperone CopZ